MKQSLQKLLLMRCVIRSLMVLNHLVSHAHKEELELTSTER